MDQPLVNLHTELVSLCKLIAGASARKEGAYLKALIADMSKKIRQIEKRQYQLDDMIQKANEAHHGSE